MGAMGMMNVQDKQFICIGCFSYNELMQKWQSRTLQGLLLFIKCWSGKMPFDGYNYMLMLSVIGV